MNPDLQRLQPYPFEKLRELLSDVQPAPSLAPISLAVGEPAHPAPNFVAHILQQQSSKLSAYPSTKGVAELRQAIGYWLKARFKLGTEPDPDSQVLPVNGTREALFAFAQAVVDRTRGPLVVMPNPFYQIYEGAALLAGAEPLLLNCTAERNFQMDFSAITPQQWQRCQLLYLCSPGNPTGAVSDVETLKILIALADQHDFIIASDECYSEIYPDEHNPPPGLLQACAELGRHDYARCVVFHSLSKRSNLPGLRSGFVAGDADILDRFLLYRTYHGCAMPIQHQLASAAAWRDEIHVENNRALYRQKFEAVGEILDPVIDLPQPDAGFYLWPQIPGSDETFTRELLAQHNVRVVPGSYLARGTPGGNPGYGRIRMALVAPLAECRDAAQRIRNLLETRGC